MERPVSPNTVIYDDELIPPKMFMSSRPNSGHSLAPPPPTYKSPMPDKSEDAHSVGGGRIWTIEGREDPEKDVMSFDEDEETRILLEKEFDDYYEDHVHKSAGPVVFVSKMLGMIPVIWTEDESESECKSYFNLYTFVIFIGKFFTLFEKSNFCPKIQFWQNPNIFTSFSLKFFFDNFSREIKVVNS